MKRLGTLFVVGLTSTALCACYSPMGRPDYTASGALAGGATGAVIGSMARHPGPGALVGGALGAVVGGLIGHGLDQEQEARLRAQAPQTMERVEQGRPLTIADVASLSRAGIGDDLILNQIRNSRTVYHLTTADIISLKSAGVSERVIDYMINTPTQLSSSAQVGGVVGQTLPPPPSEEIIPAPGPDYVWVGGAWVWFGGNWVWHRGYWHRPVHPYYHLRQW